MSSISLAYMQFVQPQTKNGGACLHNTGTFVEVGEQGWGRNIRTLSFKQPKGLGLRL